MLSTHTNSQHGKNPLSPRKSPALAAAPGDTAPPADPVDPLASSPHHQHHHHHHHEHGSAGAAGGRPASSSGAAATTLAQRLELVARRFVSNVVGWPGGSGGGSNEEEEVRGGEQQPQAGDVGSGDIETAARVASMMLAPGAAVHVGGVWADVLAPGQPNNEDALFEYLSRERAAYQLLELQPLAVAVAVDSEPAVAGLGGGGGGAAADPTPTAAAAAHGREVVEEGEKLERRDGAGGGAGGGACGGGAAAGGGGGGDVAFVLSRFRMKHVGGWLGRAPTGRVSEGLRVDELRFDPEAKIAAAWCTRQLTQEELEVLRARPEGGEGEGAGVGAGEGAAAQAKAPALEPSLLRLQASELAPHKMMQVAALWSQAWNVATDAGAVNPDLLDCLAEPTLTATDMSGLGLGGGGGSGGGVGGGGGGEEEQQHPFTAIRSRDDAKAALAALCASYEVDEGLVTAAAARGTNAAFCHWRARLTPRRRGGSSGAGSGSSGSTQDAATPQPGGGRLTAAITATTDAGSGSSGGGRGSSSGGGGHGPGSYVAEGVDLLLFAPSGKLQAIAQFRRPLGWERRTLLSAAGLAAAMAEAGVAEAAAVAKGPGVCVVDNAPAGAPEGVIA